MNKIAVAAALTMALAAVSTTEAKFKINAHKITKGIKNGVKVAQTAQQLGLLDEDEADWQFNAGLSGQVGQKPNYQVGISGKWDEEEQGFGTKLNNALNTIDHAVNTAHSLGLMDDEEQKLKLGKALKNVVKVAVTASELGLLDEDEQQGLGKKINKILDKVDKVTTTAHRIQDTVNAIKSLDEDEADWGFNAGISGQVGQKPNYNVGISAKWDEEEEQKLKLGKALKKAVKVATTAQQLGLLEEADWGFNAGISGQVGGKPSYNAGISAKWDEEEEQKFKLGKALKKAAKVAVKANELGLLEEDAMLGGQGSTWINRPVFNPNPIIFDEEQKFKLGKALKKAAHVAVKANELGLLEEADWEFNAGISGQFGGKPTVGVGITGRWEDEEQGFGTKLNNALNTIDHAVNTAHSLGLMDEEEQKIKIGRALKKVAKVAVKANELGLLEEDEQQGLGKKINKILDKVDKVTTTAHRIQDTVNSIKSLEEDNGFLLGGEGSTWVNRPHQGAVIFDEYQIPREWLR